MKALEPKIAPGEVVARLKSSRILATVMRGMIWLNTKEKTYRTDAVGRLLLETPSKSGPISDLQALFESELAESKGPQATRTIAFATPANRYLRMRFLCQEQCEQLYLVEDMTELVLSDLELQSKNQAFSGIFENANVGIHRSTLTGEHIYANPALVAMMGCQTEAEWVEKSRNGMTRFYVDPNSRTAYFKALMENGKVTDHVSELRRDNGETFWVSATAWLIHDDNGVPTRFDGTLIDVTERMRHHAMVKKASETDELTGLANRTKLYETIEARTARSSECVPFAVLLVDLDRFKDINDVFGHATGDAVLLEVSERLRGFLGEGSCVTRLGGDEFAAIIDTSVHNITEIANALVVRLRQIMSINGVDHALSASIGVSCYPDHAMSRAELLRRADIALYEVKSRTRNGLCVFSEALELSRQRTHFLAQELRGADTRGELELHYQPIVEAGSCKVMGFEALMRWHHPTRGTISPVEFIPIAEDAGFMPTFGGWAIREACAHVVTLPEHIFVSVNVSAVQFNAMDFPSIVEAALLESGLHSSRLELEVTESIVLRNEERTIEILDKLKKIGVTIALDDFGTGYSSFGYLQKFPFDKVKIDRSFVQNLAGNKTNAALVRAVLSIGRDLGLPVVAEGVENIEQRDQLSLEGCPLFQGYLFGKPQRFSDIVNNMALETMAESMKAMDVPVVTLKIA